MPPLRPFEQIDAGGVDSRSNPINMPRNRALRCLNWCPKQAGFWELRWGYSSVTMSTVSVSAIHSMFPYRTWNGNKYVLFMQGTTLKTLDTATGTVTTPTVRGTAIGSSAKGAGYFANNRFHYGNGTDQKWFDATTWRANGLPALIATDVQFITITEGVREFTPAQASTVTLTGAGGGSFAADVLSGHLVYCAIFDTSSNEIGPATINLSSGRILLTLNQKISVAVLPNLSGVNANWVKLMAGTQDGSNLAYFFTNTNTNITSCTPGNSTILAWSNTKTGPTTIIVTIQTSAAHGLSAKQIVAINPTGIDPKLSGSFPIDTVPDTTHFTYHYSHLHPTPVNASGSGGTVTGLTVVVATAHGLATGDVVIIADTGTVDGVYAVTVIDANTFQFTTPPGTFSPTGAIGTVSRIVTAANAVTTVDILAPTQDFSYQVNQNRGLAASTIGGTSAGYAFGFAIYNPNGGGHAGNFLLGGQRALQTAYRCNWRITGLPNLIASDTEWEILIGRTGDGASIPYVCADNALNWAVAISGQTSFVVTQPNLDGQHELPTRNGIIPSQCNMFCVAGDFCYAADTASPFLRRSGDLSQATERGNTFTGRPEQSWAPDDIDTFPTGEPVTGMFEIDQEVFMGTLHDSALSVNLGGIVQWVGPWPIGIAGRRAGTKCGAMGFYWLSGDKQLCTFNQGVPIVVSDEYELAELAQISDASLSTVELVYYRNASQNKEELRIEALIGEGIPYTVIHDFKLREGYSAPGSPYGQGYASQFGGPLANLFTTALVRDGNGTLQVYAGTTNGRIYQLYSGANDASVEYTADLIFLLNGGPNRPDAPFFDYYGDANVQVTVGRNLQTSLANGAEWGFDPPNADANIAQSVPGAEQDFLFRVVLVPPEVQRLYVRFQLTSHSADGNLNLNSPVHVPLEDYGRIYELVPAIGDERER